MNRNRNYVIYDLDASIKHLEKLINSYETDKIKSYISQSFMAMYMQDEQEIGPYIFNWVKVYNHFCEKLHDKTLSGHKLAYTKLIIRHLYGYLNSPDFQIHDFFDGKKCYDFL